MDGPPAQTLGVEPVDHDVMLAPPRDPSEKIINRDTISKVLLNALIVTAGTLFVYLQQLSARSGVIELSKRGTTLTFTAFVFFSLFNALSCRSQSKSIFKIGLLANLPFLVAVGLSVVGQLLMIYFPPMQSIFQTEAISFFDLAAVTCLASTVWVCDEVRKAFASMDFSKLGRRSSSIDLKSRINF